MMRSHRCGDLNDGHNGESVVLCGWVHTRRDHGGVTFIDLRDTSGRVQVVFNEDLDPEAHRTAQDLRSEFCIKVDGTVRLRPEGTVNEKLPTGAVEVAASAVSIFNRADTPPFQIDEYQEAEESLRLKYRFLDLRREGMQQNIRLRHSIVAAIRRFFDSEGFVEIETPVLTRSTPEGARDYLVPSRVHPGNFYALPQSPQLFKQLFMVAGLDRYYQIARCFRDEDLRADRQPEFTQLDMEMSFVEVDDVLSITERMFTYVWRECLGVELGAFPRLSFTESMERFGTDKPDLRYGLELVDLGHVFAATEIKIFRSVLEAGGEIKAIVVPGRGGAARKELDGIVDEAKSLGAGGLVWVARSGDEIKSPIEKFLSAAERDGLFETTSAGVDDLILIVADTRIETVRKVLAGLRTRLADRYGLIPEVDRGDAAAWRFAWIVDFPWFDFDEADQRWDPIHHPFTGITEETKEFLESDPAKVVSKSYDITLNGWELASGSIRIHDAALQNRVFEALGMQPAEIEEKFGFLLNAFRFGAPPHGGIAPGIDRIVALAAGETNIREVVAFPKTQTAFDPLTGAPAAVDEAQLKLLGLKVIPPPK